MRLARFPVIHTVAPFRWDWPTRMNRLQVQHHCRRAFSKAKANLLLLGGVGLGTTPWATALGYTACRQGASVRFARASAVLNTLAAAKSAGRLTVARTQYSPPALLLLDALG
jgi:DNA replication protein DnaC